MIKGQLRKRCTIVMYHTFRDYYYTTIPPHLLYFNIIGY